MTKRVLHLLQHAMPGGIEVLALEVQKKAKDSVILIATLEGEQAQCEDAWPRLKEHDIIYLNKAPGFSFALIQQLSDLIKNQQVDVIHSHHIGPLLYGAMAARLTGIEHVHTEHDAWHLAASSKHRWIEKICRYLSRTTMIMDSELVAKQWQTAMKRQADAVIYNGIDTDFFLPGDKQAARETLGLAHDAFVIGSAGRLETVKGHAYLIKAAALLPENHVIVIAGQGTLQAELSALIEQMQLEDKVRLLGNLNDLRPFYQALDLFVLPSLNEGLPLAPLEAQACGIPVIACDVGGTQEAVCADSGKLILPANPDAIAEAILSRDATKPSPRDYILKQRSLNTMLNEYQRFYAKGQ